MKKKSPANEAKRWREVRVVVMAGIALAAALLGGCSHLYSKVGQPLPSRPTALEIGQSHLGEVLKTVGPPSRVSPTAAGLAMFYEYNEVEESQLGFNVDVPVLRLFKLVGAKSWLEHQAWLLTFDQDGILQGWGEERWRTPLGRGYGAQILITVSSLVDSSQVRRPAPQHDWAKGWLTPLPRLLNSAYNPDTGMAGLEQTLAPTAVGQRTLDMTPAPRKFPKKK